MKPFVINIEEETRDNENFRKVLFTAPHSQLVVMSLDPEEDIGEEIHEDSDQFIRVESGFGQAVIEGEEYELENGDSIVIPTGTKHNIINTSEDETLKLYTIYSPPHHKDDTVHKTKEEAEAEAM